MEIGSISIRVDLLKDLRAEPVFRITAETAAAIEAGRDCKAVPDDPCEDIFPIVIGVNKCTVLGADRPHEAFCQVLF